MALVQDYRVSPPQIHPEFGYFCPTLPARRMMRVALIAAVCGLAFGAVGVLALSSPSGKAPDASASAAAADNGSTNVASTVGLSAAPAVSCAEQTWPFLDRPCLRGTMGWRDVRMLPATGAASSVSEPPAAEVVQVKQPEEPAAVAPTNKRDKAQQRKRSRSHRDQEAARRAYASRNGYRYERGPIYGYGRPMQALNGGWMW
jgi:hypothetical protein